VSRYRIIPNSRWTEPEFIALSRDGKLVSLFAETNRSTNAVGVYHATLEGLAAELRMPLAEFKKAFEENVKVGLLGYDNSSQVVCIMKFLDYNRPDNPSVLTGWMKCWDEIPDSVWKQLRLNQMYAACEAWGATSKTKKGRGDSFRKVLELHGPNTSGKTSPDTSPNSSPSTSSQTSGQPKPAVKKKLAKDPRYDPLKEYVTEKWKESRGCNITSVTGTGDWVQFAGMLNRTAQDPAITLEVLKGAWDRFMTSEDPFHQKQGLAYFCTKGLTQFLNGHAKKFRQSGLYVGLQDPSVEAKPNCPICHDFGAVLLSDDGPGFVPMEEFEDRHKGYRCRCESAQVWTELPEMPDLEKDQK